MNDKNADTIFQTKDVHDKTFIQNPEDIDMEDQENNHPKKVHKDSLELPEINVSKMPLPLHDITRQDKQIGGRTFQNSFINQFSSKGIQLPSIPSETSILRETLIRTEEKNYLSQYWFDYFYNMR